MIFLLIRQLKIWSHRLTVRTDGFQSSNRGSIPRGTATKLSDKKLAKIPKLKNIIVELFVVKKLPDDFIGKISIIKIYKKGEKIYLLFDNNKTL